MSFRPSSIQIGDSGRAAHQDSIRDADPDPELEPDLGSLSGSPGAVPSERPDKVVNGIRPFFFVTDPLDK